MAARPALVAVLVGALASLGASYRTQNFVVEAPTPAIAKQIGDAAEYYRKEKAQLWLSQEMPPWGQPCPLRVTVTMNGSGGATSFTFDNGRILTQDMRIEGTLDRLVASVLPHEVTHTVFAHYFRCPVPRWADEGGSVLSEDDRERNHHDQLVRQILNTPGRAIPLRRLFSLTQYPRDVMVLYAEGYSVTNFLVGKSSRQAFLTFVAHGMRGNWDAAVRAHYGYRSVEELEQAWIAHLRDGGRAPAPALMASAPAGRQGYPPASPTSRAVVRQTLPPAQPTLGAPRPIVRGVPPDEERPVAAAPPGPSWANPVSAPASGYPTPAAARPASLGGPRFEGTPPLPPPPPTATLGRPVPLGPVGPVGYAP